MDNFLLTDRLVIALHSPHALLETGLRMCPPEKSRHVAVTYPERSFLSSPVCRANIAKNGHVSRILGERAAEFLCS